MALPQQVIIDTTPESEIVSSRVISFPIQMVYEAWTKAEYLKLWWGPKGFTNTFHEFDLRVGGRWKFTMHGPEKGNYRNECIFIHIDPPHQIAWNRLSPPIFQVAAGFENIDNNKTRIIFRQIFLNERDCSKVKPFVIEKNEENFDRLEKLLVEIDANLVHQF